MKKLDEEFIPCLKFGHGMNKNNKIPIAVKIDLATFNITNILYLNTTVGFF